MKFFDDLFIMNERSNYSVSGLNKELTCINIYDTFIRNNKGILVVTSSIYIANLLYQSLLNYTDKVLLFPMDDFLTSEAVAESPEFKVDRINTLNILSRDNKYIVVTTLMGALRYLPRKEVWNNSKIVLRKGMDIDRDSLIKSLLNIGYEKEILVNGTGKIGIRGYIIDLFPVSYDDAIRIELWGDTIDSIKFFDIDSQLSKNSIDEVTIYPFTEFILDNSKEDVISKQKYLKYYSDRISILSDYLDNGIICYYDYNTLVSSYSLLLDSIKEYNDNYVSELKTDYMHSFNEIKGAFSIKFFHFDDGVIDDKNYLFKHQSVNKYNGDFNKLKEDLLKYIDIGNTVILCIDNNDMEKRVVKYLEIDNLIFTTADNIILNKINVVTKKIFEGFIFNNVVVLGKNDLFGLDDEGARYNSKYRIGTKIQTITNIDIGDYVVHETFGIGIYQGLISIEKQGFNKDYIKIMYDGGDSLYIPVENIDRITKFSGKEGSCVKLNSLSNDNWKKKKNKVREKLESIANDLLLVSAKRSMNKGFAFFKDDESQILFDSQFQYSETVDQKRAISLIKTEMEKDTPMDMLLCGDVGYGKTEVAFRAMFKAVNSGKQVAYLCPTTILSNQQYNSAKERFKSFPVNIALVNRFVDSEKQKKIMEDLKLGKIDIIFGTHRLLNDSFQYKDLGLLVVDEEQRFGVTHKEKIKQYKANVDILTLSATPIPRTLQMSLTGIRSLALIETPPKERYPIQTYVMEESNLVIKDAINKEYLKESVR